VIEMGVMERMCDLELLDIFANSSTR